MQAEVRELLKKSRLSITDSRQRILDLFLRSEGALSHADIEKRIADGIDRVTIYRTLQVFEEKGIIHTIPSADNSIKYALCKEDCAEGHHHDNHVHFVCDSCSKTICLDHVHVPDIKLPKGFYPRESNMVVSGVCRECL
jgi:Fur family ferric uptake transcriptional regulator